MKKFISLLLLNSLLACGDTDNTNDASPPDRNSETTRVWTPAQKNEVIELYQKSLDEKKYNLNQENKALYGQCGFQIISTNMNYHKWVKLGRPSLKNEEIKNCLTKANIQEKTPEIVSEAKPNPEPAQPVTVPVEFNFDDYLKTLKSEISHETQLENVDQNQFNNLVQQLENDSKKYEAALKILNENLLESIYQKRTLIVAISKVSKIENSKLFEKFIDSSINNKSFIRELLYSISSNPNKGYYRYAVLLHVFINYREDTVLLDIAYKSLKQFGYFSEISYFFPVVDLKHFVDARADSEDPDQIKLTVAKLMLGVEHLHTVSKLLQDCVDNKCNANNSDLTSAMSYMSSYYDKYEVMKKYKQTGNFANIDPGIRAFINHSKFDELMKAVDTSQKYYLSFVNYVIF